MQNATEKMSSTNIIIPLDNNIMNNTHLNMDQFIHDRGDTRKREGENRQVKPKN